MKIKFNCDYCGKEVHRLQNQFNKHKNHFCSQKCSRKWLNEVFWNREEMKLKRKEYGIMSLKNNNKTLTEPHLIILNLLDKLNISNNNREEKLYDYYSCDIFLDFYNLPIEVMGSYWHCDHRVYDIISYESQRHRIKIDKSKHNYILNKYGCEILYLWEYDIKNNIDICKKLILKYVNNKGLLKDYHSFNYEMDDNLYIKLIKNIQIPYMYWDCEKIKSITSIKLKEKICKKQHNKWIKYNCEYCGKNCEELISHYVKKNHHYCSNNCRFKSDSKNGTKIVKCSYCNKEIKITNTVYIRNKNKIFYCNLNCKKSNNNVKVRCDICKKEFTIVKSKYNKSRSKIFYCSRYCYKNKGSVRE